MYWFCWIYRQQASLPAVHLAAALAVEAGSVARAVAMHASTPQHQPGDSRIMEMSPQTSMTDESLLTEEEVDSEPSLSMQLDPEYKAACIV